MSKKAQNESTKIISDVILFTPVDTIFGTRTANCLKSAGIEFVSDLIKCSKSNIRKIHGLGPKMYYEILLGLEHMGLGLDNTTMLHKSLQSVAATKNAATIATIESKSHIYETDLSKRAQNILMGAGIDTIGQLTKKTKAELCKIPGFGHHSMVEVEHVLEKRGLKLADTKTTKPIVHASAEPKTLLDIKALESFAQKLSDLVTCANLGYDAAKKSSDNSLREALETSDMHLRKLLIQAANESATFAERELKKRDSLSERIDEANKLIRMFYSSGKNTSEINTAIAEFLTNAQQNTK